jgi:uncharacterized protein (TIGR00730 family)
MKSVCVFCGSSPGAIPEYLDAASALGQVMAARGITLVYGGASVGVMGAVADSALAGGGKVIGVIPESLVSREVAHSGLPDLRVVGTMHQRKAMMSDLSEGFIALPGGIGTLEELFEVLSWAQLGIHGKPCAVLNVAGYYDRLLDFLDYTVSRGFVRQNQRELLLVDETPEALLDRMGAYHPPVREQWMGRRQR